MKPLSLFIKDAHGLFNRVETYADERVTITSTIQDISDISKTKTDYSQTFNIPATKTNNKIFSHWYDNSIDNGFSHLLKKDAYIEIDTLPFRTGLVQLESVEMNNQIPVNYKITFYGALVSLKDLFAGLSLKDLIADTSFDFVASGALIKTKVTTGPDDDVMFPLITSERVWDYNGAVPANNVDTVGGAIVYSELFPAIRVASVIQMIETQFGISFTGDFLTNAKFTSLYLWLKNQDTFSIKEFPTAVPFDNVVHGNPDGFPSDPFTFDTVNYTYSTVQTTQQYRTIKVYSFFITCMMHNTICLI